MRDFLEGGDFNKFIVVKEEDISRYLNLTKAKEFGFCLDVISNGRREEGENPDNKYLVINVDEPYAPEIVEILKRNGHWG